MSRLRAGNWQESRLETDRKCERKNRRKRARLSRERSGLAEEDASQEPQTTQVSGSALELCQVISAVSRSIPLEKPDLPDEFFPAHLSVALIDAIFHSRLRYGEQPAPGAERYCSRFEIARTRADRWKPPPADEQETLGDLIRHYDEFGVVRMANEVFRTRRRFPGTKITRSESVLHAARALRCVGVDVLQDVWSRRPAEIDDALRSVPGGDDGTGRILLMYTGGDDFVLGDPYVRRFVANAIGRRTVSAARAVALVRSAAYELLVSPRFLDREIRRFGASW